MEEENTPKIQKRIDESKKQVKRLLKKAEREQGTKGVVYLSRIPPYMNVVSLRRLLEEKFEQVERIYLEKEKESQRKDRMKSGGNKKQKYTEGWVEFKDKKIAN